MRDEKGRFIKGHKVTDNQAMKRLYRGAKKQIWAKE